MTKASLAIALTLSTAGLSLVGALPAQAAALTGAGSHMLIPSPNPGQPAEQASVLSNIVGSASFDGTWTSPALPAWGGTFHATGPVPNSFVSSGTTSYDFTSLAAGILPVGTLFQVGDLDSGTFNENFTFRAFDSTNTLISSPWLDEAVGVNGSGSGPGGVPSLADMPSWAFTGGIYSLSGNSVPGNPNVFIWLTSNTQISFLEVVRTTTSYGFELGAPIPVPATGLIGLLALPVLAWRRR